MAFDDLKNNPELGKSMAKWAALGAVVAIPLPFVGPIIGAAVGAGVGYVRNKSKG